MNQLRNSVQLIGFLGNNPETRTFNDNKSVTRFTMATNESYRNEKGERITTTQWHNCVVWGKLGQTLQQMLSKGRQVAIQGKLTYREYKGEDGQSRRLTEIVVENFLAIESRQAKAKEEAPAQAPLPEKSKQARA